MLWMETHCSILGPHYPSAVSKGQGKEPLLFILRLLIVLWTHGAHTNYGSSDVLCKPALLLGCVPLVQALIKWLSPSCCISLKYLLVVVNCLKRKNKMPPGMAFCLKARSNHVLLAHESCWWFALHSILLFLCVVYTQHIPWIGLKIYLTEFFHLWDCVLRGYRVILLQDWHKGMSHLTPTDWCLKISWFLFPNKLKTATRFLKLWSDYKTEMASTETTHNFYNVSGFSHCCVSFCPWEPAWNWALVLQCNRGFSWL